VRGDEPGDIVAPVLAAPLAADSERRLADVGQGQRAVAWHGAAAVTAMRIIPGAREESDEPRD
jgi:hypothetical protein